MTAIASAKTGRERNVANDVTGRTAPMSSGETYRGTNHIPAAMLTASPARSARNISSECRRKPAASWFFEFCIVAFIRAPATATRSASVPLLSRMMFSLVLKASMTTIVPVAAWKHGYDEACFNNGYPEWIPSS